MKRLTKTLFYAVFCTSLLTATATQPVDYNNAKTALKHGGAAYFGAWAIALSGKAINYTFDLNNFVENTRHQNKETIKYRIASFANSVTNFPMNCLKKLHSGQLCAAAVCGGLSYGCYRLARYIIQ